MNIQEIRKYTVCLHNAPCVCYTTQNGANNEKEQTNQTINIKLVWHEGVAFWTEALRILIDASLYIVALGIIRWNDIMRCRN